MAGSLSNNNLQIWNASTGAVLLTLQGHTDKITQLQSSSDGTRLASSSYDGSVRVWNASNGAQLQAITNLGRVYAVDWSPNGSQIAYGGNNGSIVVAAAPPPATNTIVFQTNHDGNDEICTMNNHGTNPVRRTTNTFVDTSPDG